MVKRRIGKQLNGVFAALMILFACCIPAMAAPVGSLQVIVLDSADQSVENIAVEVICVAGISGGTCALKPEFTSLDISGTELLSNPSAEYAEKVYQYVYAQELEGTIKLTNGVGKANFPGLSKGVYLVFEHGGQAVSFEPYLVTIPSVISGSEAYSITSTPKTTDTDTKTLACQKFWEDNLDAAGKRPDSILVTVYRDGVPFRTVTLSAANSWQHKFYMLPNTGIYTVEESPVTDYQAAYTPVLDGCIIVNTYIGGSGSGGGGGGGTPPEPDPTPAHVCVTKIWDDDDNAEGKRPGSITVQLLQDNTVIKTAMLSKANSWKYTFTGLDASKTYTVKEITVTDYSASYSGSASTGIYILNRYTGATDPGTPPPPVIPQPEQVSIPVSIQWEDQNDAAGKRPGVATVHLIADGSIIATLQLYPGNSWKGTFSGVPADLSYTVWQVGVAEYTTAYAGNANEGFVITNTYTEGKTDPGIPPTPTPPQPDQPEVPVDPEKPPVSPSEPMIPQTGAEVFPVYLMMTIGICLVLLGVIDLYRGRVCYEEED